MHHTGWHHSLDEESVTYCAGCKVNPSNCLLVFRDTDRFGRGEVPFCTTCIENGNYDPNFYRWCIDMEEVIEDEC